MFGDLLYKIGIDGSAASRTLSGLQSGVGSLHGALLTLGVGAGFAKVIKDGFEFNQTMHDGELAIAAIVQQFQNLDAASAKQVAAGAMQKLVDMEPKVAGSLSDIVQGFSSTAAAAAGVGITVNQNIDLVGRFANALAKLNMPVEQVGQELRSILTGNIGADSQLARTLGITNEMAGAAKEAGNLYEMLVAKVGKLGEAGDNAATRFSSLKSAIQKAEGALASGLFEQAIDGSVQLTEVLNDNKEAFKEIGQGISEISAIAVQGVGFMADWGNAIGVGTSILRDMAVDGLSYYDALEKAEETLTFAINERNRAAQEAAADAPAPGLGDALAGGGAAKNGSGGATKTKREPGEEDPAKVFDEIYAKQERLDDLKRSSAEDEMSTAQKIAATRERLAAAVEREAAIKSIDLTDPRLALDAEEKRVTLARELAQLLREEGQVQEALAKKSADKAAAARKEVEAHNQSRNSLMGELAILEAQASGHDKKAKALQRELQIANDTQTIMREQQTTEENALRLATRKADLQDKLAKRRDRDGNRDENQGAHIGGVTKSKRSFGGLAEFDALQKGPTLGIAGPGRASSLDAFKKMQRGGEDSNIKLLGGGRGQALSDRFSQATTLPKPDAGNKKEDPLLAELRSMNEQLKRIRTA